MDANVRLISAQTLDKPTVYLSFYYKLSRHFQCAAYEPMIV